jgi:transposase
VPVTAFQPAASVAVVNLDAPPTAIGVGIDTSRYGHHATFLRADLQPAAEDLDFAESAAGYEQLRRRLENIAQRHAAVHFHFRLDVAGAYADNLLAFLQRLSWTKTISCGDPQRNKNYRSALYGHKKSDPVESAAVARYALTEKPQAMPTVTPELSVLRQIAGRLEAQTRHCTRVVNQLHHLLARAFPELALLTKDLAAGWVLKLLDRYPTPAKLAATRPASIAAIPYLDHDHIPRLQEYARSSVASLTGPIAEALVRDHVRQVTDAQARQKSLEKLLVDAYQALPFDNHLNSITGIGDVTAAVLTAKIVDIDRFVDDNHLVGYFGTFPVEAASGVDRDGKRRAPRRWVMCPRGSDLVRRYLYMAALSAGQHNPAVKHVYQRVRAKHPDHPGIAVGRAMNKLLRLAFAVWKSGKPFDPEHYPWEQPGPRTPPASSTATAATAPSNNEQAAGHNPEAEPDQQVVTAACSAPQIATAAGTRLRSTSAANTSDIHMSQDAGATASPGWIDFAHVRKQLPLERVLDHLHLLAPLRGRGRQRRGPCPVHDSSGKGRTFSVHLDKNVFQCFDPKCGIKGDVIDLWAAVKTLPLRDAALDLIRTFALEPAPTNRTEKRHG